MPRFLCVLLLLPAILASTRAHAWSENPTTPEGWAWAQIKAGYPANFNTHCNVTLDPRDPKGWDAPCRQIDPQFIVDLLTVPQWQAQVGRRGVRLRGAHITDDLNLADAEIASELWLDDSRIDGELILSDADLKGVFSLDGSVLMGKLMAFRMKAESLVEMSEHAVFNDDVHLGGASVGGNLVMYTSSFAKSLDCNSLSVHGSVFMSDHATFTGDVDLRGASIGSDLYMDTAAFAQDLDADSLQTGGALVMRDHASFAGDVDLRGASIGAGLEMETSTFAKTLNANSLVVHGPLFMNDHATFAGDVDLRGASIGSNLEMETASFAKTLNANGMVVHGALFMRDHASFAGEVDLGATSVGGDLEMTSASFAQGLSAQNMDVHSSVFMNNATFNGFVDLNSAKLGWLDLGNSTATSIDLSDLTGAPGSELQLGGLTWHCPTPAAAAPPSSPATPAPPPQTWPLGTPSWHRASCNGGKDPPPHLILRNAHIDTFQDSRDAWPPDLDLEGFHYDRIGGINGYGRADMRLRTPPEWVDWLARDPIYSAQPYLELAAVMASAGDRDTADTILYAGRERERAELLSRPDTGSWRWAGHDLPSYLWLSFLSIVAGYGIGLYTFRVLLWVIGLTILGAALLHYSPYARQRGIPWRFGASLQHLLPGVTFGGEFEEFFNGKTDPDGQPKLNPALTFFFASMALAGWVLGFFLLAAMGGLIQK